MTATAPPPTPVTTWSAGELGSAPGDAHAACHRRRRHRGVYLTCAFCFLAGGAMALLMLGELAVPGM
jgi:hypothetical protein